ncbi:MAG: hypothetical protein ACE5OS_10175, partial [Anaerolineae bacterium]
MDSGQFIGTQDAFAFLGQFRGLAIQGIDVFNLLVELIIGDWRQPIAHLVRFEISIFLSLFFAPLEIVTVIVQIIA